MIALWQRVFTDKQNVYRKDLLLFRNSLSYVNVNVTVSGGTSSCVTLIFQHHMFNMEYRHLLNLSVQNTLDYISENFNLKNFSWVACTRNSLEKCAVRSSDGCQRAHIATAYIFRPHLSQNLPSARDKDGHSPAKKRISAPFLKFIYLCSPWTL